MAFQVVNLLVPDEDLPGHLRAALAEGRLVEAGIILMDTFGLTCWEAGELVDLILCEDEHADAEQLQPWGNEVDHERAGTDDDRLC